MIYEVWAAILKKRRSLFIAAVILFPILTNLIRHTGSLFLTLFAAAGLLFVLSSSFRPPLKKYQKWVMGCFSAYSGVYVVSFVLNGLLGVLTDLRLRHLDHETRFLEFIPIFLLFRFIRLPQKAIWIGISSGAVLSGVYALISHFWLVPDGRVSGSYHSIAFGDLSLVMAFMSIPALDYFKNKSIVYRLFPILAFIMGILASILSGTRGSWIAFPALALVLFYYLSTMIKLLPRLACVAVVLLLLFSSYAIEETRIADRIDSVVAEVNAYRSGDRTYTSIGTRIEGWHVAFDIFIEHPIMGAGPGNYAPLMHQMISEGKQYEIAVRHSQPHGVFPSVMADTGVLGLLALMGVFLAPLGIAIGYIRFRKEVRHLGYAIMILVVGFMHFGMTESIFSRNINLTFYIILIAAMIAVAANEMEKTVR